MSETYLKSDHFNGGGSIDPISYSPSLAKEIENEYGKTTLDGLQRIGFVFEDEPTG